MKCLAAGMDDYLSKPFKAGDLQEVLGRWELSQASGAAVEEISLNLPDAPVPVDVERLLDAAGGDPGDLQSLVGLYMGQMIAEIEKLKVATEAGDAPAIEQITHMCAGSSAMCGMDAIVGPLRELELLSHESRLESAAELTVQIGHEFGRIKLFLDKHLKQVPA